MLRKVMLVLVCVLTIGCSEGQGPKDAGTGAGLARGAQEENHFLVFFLDPNGGPCIMQAQILDSMKEELQGRAAVRYVQTTVPDDRGLFTQYGIRSLPSLLLADASGRELQRLAPGVKNAGEIRKLLQAIN